MILSNVWCSKAKNFLVSLQKHHPVFPVGISEYVQVTSPLCSSHLLLPQNKGGTPPISSSTLTVSRGFSYGQAICADSTPLISEGLVRETCLCSHLGKLLRSWCEQIFTQSCKRQLATLISWTFWKVPHDDKEPCSLYSLRRDFSHLRYYGDIAPALKDLAEQQERQ